MSDQCNSRGTSHGSKQTARYWALALAGCGFKIFPLPAGKKVPECKWTDVATRDQNQIESWFEATPGMNYGVWPEERFVVIDLDDKGGKNGTGAWPVLQFENEDYIETFSVKTPHGEHHYFRTPFPVGNSNQALPDGIDVRGAGGYVVGPGSRYEGKRYEAQDSDLSKLADAPEWLLKHFKQKGQQNEHAQTPLVDWDLPVNLERAKAFLDKSKPAIEGQGGNEHTYHVACSVRDFAISEERCLALLEETGWNARCEPPWPPSELARVVHNAYQYAQSPAGARVPLIEQISEAKLESLAGCGEADSDEAKITLRREKSDLEAITYRGNAYVELEGRREMLVPDLIPAQGITAVLAKRGTGKTVFMIDLALRFALDRDWTNGMSIAKGHTVIYCVGEDDVGVRAFIDGWRKHHGIVALPRDRFIVMDDVPNLMDAERVAQWCAHLCKIAGANAKPVIFLDTWQQASSGGAQSDDAHMQKALKHADQLMEALNGPMIMACHPPKAQSDTVMGSSTIENVTHAILHITEQKDGTRVLEVTRAKGFKGGEKRRYRLCEVELGEKDRNDQERKTIVADYGSLIDRTCTEPDIRAIRMRAVREVLKAATKQRPSLEQIARQLSKQEHEGILLPGPRQLKRDIRDDLAQPYRFSDEVVLKGKKRGRRWHFELSSASEDSPAKAFESQRLVDEGA